MNAAAVAVVATERSTPPVSITSVCPAAISPSTAPNRNVVETCLAVRNAWPSCARLMMSVARNSPRNTTVRTTAGLSTKHRRQRASSRWPAGTVVMSHPAVGRSSRLPLLSDREPSDHDDEHDERALDHLGPVLVDAADDEDRL